LVEEMMEIWLPRDKQWILADIAVGVREEKKEKKKEKKRRRQ
jgi:hypothetical protein